MRKWKYKQNEKYNLDYTNLNKIDFEHESTQIRQTPKQLNVQSEISESIFNKYSQRF